MEMRYPFTEKPATARRPRRLAWMGLAVLALAAGGASVFLLQPGDIQQRPASRRRPTPILAAAARTGGINIYLNRLGTVTARTTVTVPGRVGDANGLVVITQLQPITVVFTIPQDNLPGVLKRLRSGERLPVEAYDREQKVKLATGELLTVDNQIDPSTGTVKLKAQFPNEDGGLFPNQFVNVRMLLDTRRDATLAPSAAVVRGGQGTFVYVINEDRTVALRKVNVGIAEADSVSVESGLAPGERVVVEGSDRLRDGAKVEIPDRAASAAPGKSGKAPGKGEGKRRRKEGA